MAWQLIYTSAPRLLEAGRSGFGTVARHRAIHPLLVTAIERDSQFDRSAGGVVFAHRLLSAAGSRFHVLTCIRDAGADYTGRTNHIAHHLIVEPYEITALGSAAPSPADVLAQMGWLSSWSENPRWLDGADEIPLGRFLAHPGAPSAWQSATGEFRRAALLQPSGDACLLHPPGMDVLPLLAESLNRRHSQAWQATFTTSLQPGDDPSDFHWIALPATSSLRSSIENGRSVFDLTTPQSLPIPASPLPSSLPPPSVTRREDGVDFHAPTSRVSPPARLGNLFDEKLAAAAAPRPARRQRARGRRRAVFWLGVATALLALFAGAYAFFEQRETDNALKELESAMEQAFGSEAEISADIPNLRSNQREAAKSLTAALRATVDEIRKGELTERQTKANDESRGIAKAKSLNVPREANQLFNFHAEASRAQDLATITALVNAQRDVSVGRMAKVYLTNYIGRVSDGPKDVSPPLNSTTTEEPEDSVDPQISEELNPGGTPEIVPPGERFEGKLIILSPSDTNSWKSLLSELRSSEVNFFLIKGAEKERTALIKRGPNAYGVNVSQPAMFSVDTKTNVLVPAAAAPPAPYELGIFKNDRRIVTGWVPTANEPLRTINGGLERDEFNFRLSSEEALDLLRVAREMALIPELELCNGFFGLDDMPIRIPLAESGVADASGVSDQIKARIKELEEVKLDGNKTSAIQAALDKVNGKSKAPEGDDSSIRENNDAIPPAESVKSRTELVNPRDLELLGLHMMSYGESVEYEKLHNAGAHLKADEEQLGNLSNVLPGLIAATEMTIEEVRKSFEKSHNSDNIQDANKSRDFQVARLNNFMDLLKALKDEEDQREKAKQVALDAEGKLEQLKENPLAISNVLPPGDYRVIVQPPGNGPALTLVLFKIPGTQIP